MNQLNTKNNRIFSYEHMKSLLMAPNSENLNQALLNSITFNPHNLCRVNSVVISIMLIRKLRLVNLPLVTLIDIGRTDT